MPLGVQFDHAGNMSAVHIGADSVLSELYEVIGCRVVTPVQMTEGVALWVDAEGADNGQSHNQALSTVAIQFGYTEPIYGPGVFLGCADNPNEVKDLTHDARLAIVMHAIGRVHLGRALTHN